MICTTKIACILFFFASVLSAQNIEATHNRVFLNYASMFSAEPSIGYERRVNDFLGLAVEVKGGMMVTSLAKQIYDIGIQPSLYIYFSKPTAVHQFYGATQLGLSFGRQKETSREEPPKSTNVFFTNLSLLGGYRFNFNFPLSLDAGLGLDVFSIAIGVKENTRSFYPRVPLFAHLGISYRF